MVVISAVASYTKSISSGDCGVIWLKPSAVHLGWILVCAAAWEEREERDEGGREEDDKRGGKKVGKGKTYYTAVHTQWVKETREREQGFSEAEGGREGDGRAEGKAWWIERRQGREWEVFGAGPEKEEKSEKHRVSTEGWLLNEKRAAALQTTGFSLLMFCVGVLK